MAHYAGGSLLVLEYAVGFSEIWRLTNWPGLGLLEISDTKKTKLLGILEKMRCSPIFNSEI